MRVDRSMISIQGHVKQVSLSAPTHVPRADQIKLLIRCRAKSAHRPDYGLGLSHLFPIKFFKPVSVVPVSLGSGRMYGVGGLAPAARSSPSRATSRRYPYYFNYQAGILIISIIKQVSLLFSNKASDCYECLFNQEKSECYECFLASECYEYFLALTIVHAHAYNQTIPTSKA